MRIVFVQHGDYREVAARFAAGEEESYYAQKYSVDFVAGLRSMAERVSVICLAADEPYEDVVTDTGVHTFGLDVEQTGPVAVIPIVERERPTHILTRSPVLPLIAWACQHDVRVFPILADSFRVPGFKERLRHRKIARTLNHPAIEWVANHSINASKDLARIGVRADKIVPFDWPDVDVPDGFTPKEQPANGVCRLIYAGQLSEKKGVGDLVAATKLLRDRGMNATLTLVGEGQRETFAQRAAQLGIGDAVTFTGRITHTAVLERMRAHDVVVVASRHDYPEGQPNALYDALISRTPLVFSDHPMFDNKIVDGYSGARFRAADPQSLADVIDRVHSTPELYARLSRNALEAARTFRVRALWGDVITHWLRNEPADREWLAAHTLPAYLRANDAVR